MVYFFLQSLLLCDRNMHFFKELHVPWCLAFKMTKWNTEQTSRCDSWAPSLPSETATLSRREWNKHVSWACSPLFTSFRHFRVRSVVRPCGGVVWCYVSWTVQTPWGEISITLTPQGGISLLGLEVLMLRFKLSRFHRLLNINLLTNTCICSHCFGDTLLRRERSW